MQRNNKWDYNNLSCTIFGKDLAKLKWENICAKFSLGFLFFFGPCLAVFPRCLSPPPLCPFSCGSNLFDLAAEPLTRIDCPKGQKTASGLKDKRQALPWARTSPVGGNPIQQLRAANWTGPVGWCACKEIEKWLPVDVSLTHLHPIFCPLAFGNWFQFDFSTFFHWLLAVTADRFTVYQSAVYGD